MKKIYIVLLLAGIVIAGCKEQKTTGNKTPFDKKAKIVSLSGAISEVLVAAGLEQNIVGVDVTSTFPASLRNTGQLGHVRNLQAEGILSLNPQVVFARKADVKPELVSQLEKAGITVYLFEHDPSLKGTETFIQELTSLIGEEALGKKLNEAIQEKIAKVETFANPPRVLFIYARGAGNIMVAGDESPLERMIELAKGENAVSGFKDFKPLSSEALIAANPHVILMFDSGANSLEEKEGLPLIPGIENTIAGQQKQIITMDGQFLSGFGPRLGEAALELNQKFKEFEGQ